MPGDNLCLVMGKFNQTRAEARREKLIEAARALFAENGFHATGMAEIARRSGIAVGQIYRDFAGKEDIVAEIVTRDCALFLSAATLKNAIEAAPEGSSSAPAACSPARACCTRADAWDSSRFWASARST